jgi:tRNA(Ile)-lysidine synthase
MSESTVGKRDNDGVEAPRDLPGHVRERLTALAPEARLVAVGVSGGGDSVALALALAETGAGLALLHVDHGLRAGSADDAVSVRALGDRLAVPVREERVDVRAAAAAQGWNLADAARRLRLAALHRMAKQVGADVIALGHTLDDQAETVLLQLLRGVAYPSGMRERRGRLVRPVLGVRRARLRRFLEERGVPWREDPSNEDPSSRRVRVRTEVLPLLDDLAPGASERLARLATVQGDVAALVCAEARLRLRGLAAGAGPGDEPPELDQGVLARLPPALQREAIAELLRLAGVPVDVGHVEAVRARLGAEAPWRVSVGRDRWLRGAYGSVAVVGPSGAAPKPVVITQPEDLPAGVEASVLIAGPLELRTRRPGDVVRLPGGRKRLSRLLVDRKVPRERRGAVRVLARGSEVLWVDGVALAVGAGPDAGIRERPEETWMRRALELADEAARLGEAPVGAVVVVAGEVVGEGYNRTEVDADPSAHAEVLALREAARRTGDWRLPGATLVVTLEPCPMCFGALLQAHVARVVYGAPNLREGALGSVTDLSTAGWKRRVAVEGGVLARACGQRISRFFERARGSAGENGPDEG